MYSPDDLLLLAPDQSVLTTATGEFARQLLVLSLADAEASVNNRFFLTKVLVAAQLNLDRDALFVEVPATQPVGLLMDIRRKKPDHILVFGLPAAQLGLSINVQLYQPFEFRQMTFLFADALPALEQNKEKKGQLWTALKTMFL